jgi:hypothetical protein
VAELDGVVGLGFRQYRLERLAKLRVGRLARTSLASLPWAMAGEAARPMTAEHGENDEKEANERQTEEGHDDGGTAWRVEAFEDGLGGGGG